MVNRERVSLIASSESAGRWEISIVSLFVQGTRYLMPIRYRCCCVAIVRCCCVAIVRCCCVAMVRGCLVALPTAPPLILISGPVLGPAPPSLARRTRPPCANSTQGREQRRQRARRRFQNSLGVELDD